jgi:hypothetical protein
MQPVGYSRTAFVSQSHQQYYDHHSPYALPAPSSQYGNLTSGNKTVLSGHLEAMPPLPTIAHTNVRAGTSLALRTPTHFFRWR